MSGYEYEDTEGEPYEHLAARLDLLEQAAQEVEYDDSEDGYVAYQYAAEAQQDGRTARQHLEEVAEQTRQAVFAQASHLPQAPATDEEIFAEARDIRVLRSTGRPRARSSSTTSTRTGSTWRRCWLPGTPN